MKVTGPFVSTIKNKNPGPGSYETTSALSRTSYSMRGKSFKQDKERLLVPGPGSCK